MSKFPDCPQSGRLSCTISEVADAIAAGPTWFDWLTLAGIPFLVAAATFMAVAVSLKVAKQAKTQADESEMERKCSEMSRIEEERRMRFGDALARFQELAANFMERMQAFADEQARYDGLPATQKAVALRPRQPFIGLLVLAINAAKMEGSRRDIEMLDLVRDVVIETEGLGLGPRMQRLVGISELMVKWHSGGDEERVLVERLLPKLLQAKTLDAVQTLLYDEGLIKKKPMEKQPV